MNTPFSRSFSVAFLALIASTFGANHIVARIAFDDGAGVALAVLSRSSLCATILGVLSWRLRSSFQVASGVRPWLALAGILVVVQSLSVYSAVARIPVALALLVFNLFPVLFVLLSWRTGGERPTGKAFALIAIILFGLTFVLNVPQVLNGVPWTRTFSFGVGFALIAAFSFAGVLWITERKLQTVAGPTRPFFLQAIVVLVMLSAMLTQALPSETWARPRTSTGVWALVGVALIYGFAFSTLFVLMPRLNMTNNAPALNVEPVATLFMGWFILGQLLNGTQWIGAAIVVAGVLGLSFAKR